jgi:hypothetical protein
MDYDESRESVEHDLNIVMLRSDGFTKELFSLFLIRNKHGYSWKYYIILYKNHYFLS